jgi:Ni,Fe-hydrogenase I large subunit
VTIRDGLVARYQVVDGSTWNAAPGDAMGGRGPIEAALAGIPVADPGRPLEIARAVHAFAPCAACAAHLFDPRAAGPLEIRASAVGGTR